jgi:hypothetical protein
MIKTLKIFCIIVITLFAVIYFNHNYNVSAQGRLNWSPQQQIPGYMGDTHPPILIAAKNYTVHAFSYQPVGVGDNVTAIIYSQWSLDQGWTLPVDILLSPFKREARLLSVFQDKDGMIHLIFFGGDNTEANIYYAEAPASVAGSVSAWSTPIMIGEGALNPENGAIGGDDDGNLVVVFSGNQFGNGLYVVYSNDNGKTWSSPTPIFLTGNGQLYPFESRFYLGQSGHIYTVWSVYDVVGHGVAIYFSWLNVSQKLWTNIQKIVTGYGLGADLPNIIENKGQLIITYYNSNANAQWMIQSRDYGESWTQPARISSTLIGRNGASALVADSNSGLHFLFGGRKPGNPDIHGMWHSVFQGSYWSVPEAVVSGPQVVDRIDGKAFDPYDARAIVVQGDVLLATWRSDPGLKGNGVWYSYKILDTPEQSSASSEEVKPAIVSNPVASSVVSNTLLYPTPSFVPFEYPYGTSKNNLLNNPANALIIGIFPVFLLIVIVTVYINLTRHNHF